MISARTKSADDTQALALSLAAGLNNGDLVLLIGEIGVGKTTFTKGLAVGLGITESVTSPTFVLLHTYEGRIRLHHIDIYRVDHLQEVIDLGLMEMLDEGGIALMEWGDVAAPVLPNDRLEISLSIDDDNLDTRRIELRGVGSNWSVREPDLRQLVEQWVQS